MTKDERWKDAEPSGEDQPGSDLNPGGTLHGGTRRADRGRCRGQSGFHNANEIWAASGGHVESERF